MARFEKKLSCMDFYDDQKYPCQDNTGFDNVWIFMNIEKKPCQDNTVI